MRLPTDHGVPGSNPRGVPFVHLQMGDAKDRSPKKIVKCDMDLEMRDAKGTSPDLRGRPAVVQDNNQMLDAERLPRVSLSKKFKK